MTKLLKRENETAQTILKARYLRRNENGETIETIEDLFKRVAYTAAKADSFYNIQPNENNDPIDFNKTYSCFYEMLSNFDFLPNSPTLMNAGTELGMLSACFVLPVGDSMEDIFTTLKDTAMIHKAGGGTGFNFSHLRSEGSFVKSTSGESSGPISFMKVFNAATEVVKQGGKRRGASLATLRVDHVDILKFIMCKDDLNELNNFNISVAVTDDFMKAVADGTDYSIYNHKGEVVETLNAKMVFDMLVHQAWKNGEPGILFIDTMNATNVYGTIEATNPCG